MFSDPQSILSLYLILALSLPLPPMRTHKYTPALTLDKDATIQ